MVSVMAVLPGYCDLCGREHEVRNLIGGDGSVDHLVIEDTTAGTCQCGGTIRVVDGVYTFKQDVVTLISAMSADRRRELAEQLDAARRSSDPLTAAQAVVAGDPALRELAALRYAKAQTYLALIAVLIALLMGYHEFASGPAPQQNVTNIEINVAAPPKTSAPRLVRVPRPAPAAARSHRKKHRR